MALKVNPMFRYCYWLLLVMLIACAPKEQVVFRKVLNVRVDVVNNTPILKGDMVFYNPNKQGAKLKKIDIDLFVNEKKGGEVNQVLNQKIKGESEFTVPIEVKVNAKELGLFDTLINILGGKKYTIRMAGKIRLSINGFAISVPVDESQELKLKF